ncbi:hypothetical protein Achl_4217 (plasmid) [Pseudarthrobacter chlorophenolicus A6]|uniref:Uncharacterized protein n=1 Tax=Pseudarthrobacter chlorophenolicus (strain ATCC 700700 / DSM 12829 / CIP 107037 / JCM 12360 / KCTC 9906 / NCIMB 13794 / A6) TaxID=452863 RepID=B8HIC1_PSECP|nr:hypothetical protein [Pseudarthrobacter chlorophenolicus]ACL42168.1 hypothetical protein Achl_4217 [Pseudarthrobacter chlorophenolicus A6]SDQ14338.1 hypothetical protein SAMN04489738_0275 [Pseudarthrobacter chlorophenolicus]
MPIPTQPPNQNRQPQGVPAGGQFAASTHAEPKVSLSAQSGFFTEEDNDPNIMANASRFDGDTGDDPSYNFLGEGSGGSGGELPPTGGSGGDGGDGDERRNSQIVVIEAFQTFESELTQAKTISLTTNAYGKIRVDGIHDASGESLDDPSYRLSGNLNSQINAHAPGGRAIPAEHIIGNRKSATIDAQAAVKGEIRIVSLPPLP